MKISQIVLTILLVCALVVIGANCTKSTPSLSPTPAPKTSAPAVKPSAAPTVKPSAAPTAKPSAAPTTKPSAAPAQKTGVIKIGHPTPLSGPGSLWGVQFKQAIEAYVSVLNKKGGVAIGDTRYTLQVVHADDKLTPQGATEAADLLLETSKVDVVLGHWTPALVAIFGPRVAAKNVLHIGGFNAFPGSAEVISPKWPNTFGAHWAGEDLWTRQVGELKKQGFLPGVKNVAVLCKDDTVGVGLLKILTSDAVKKMWETEYGLKQVYAKQYAAGATDFAPLLREMKALPEKVDVINASSALSGNLVLMAKQGAEINPDIWPIVSIATLTDVGESTKIAGAAPIQKFYGASGAPWDMKGVKPAYIEEARSVAAEYQALYKTALSYVVSYEYGVNPLAVYLDAAKKAGSIKTDDVRKTLETREIDHMYGTSKATGIKTYGINHWLSYPMIVHNIQGMELKATVILESNVP